MVGRITRVFLRERLVLKCSLFLKKPFVLLCAKLDFNRIAIGYEVKMCKWRRSKQIADAKISKFYKIVDFSMSSNALYTRRIVYQVYQFISLFVYFMQFMMLIFQLEA